MIHKTYLNKFILKLSNILHDLLYGNIDSQRVFPSIYKSVFN